MHSTCKALACGRVKRCITPPVWEWPALQGAQLEVQSMDELLGVFLKMSAPLCYLMRTVTASPELLFWSYNISMKA